MDLACIDGHHQYQPPLDYFEALWRYSRQTAIFVFDDIRWSEGCCVRGRSCAPIRASISRWTLVLSASDSGQPAVHEPRPERCTQCSIRGIPAKTDLEERSLRG